MKKLLLTKHYLSLWILAFSSVSYGNSSRLDDVSLSNKFNFESISYFQETTITGTILDSNNQPLAGASIVEKGTTNGTQTDFDGNFQLDVSNPDAVLVVSYIGFASQEIPLAGETSINVSLKEDAANLDEVVVIGYGTQKKSDLTGAVGSVKSEELAERPAASLNQAMAGRVAGVNVTSGSGRPGGRTVVRIRGNTSVSIANTPLYVVDGVILNAVNLPNGSTPIDYMNPNDIESIEVLKDAAAAAIYGSRASNGVVIITTKRGKSGKPKVSINSYVGIQNPIEKYDYSLGNKTELNVWGIFNLFEWMGITGRLKIEEIGKIEGNVTDMTSDLTPYGGYIENTGSSNQILGVGANFIIPSSKLPGNNVITIEYELPIKQDVNGIQMTQENNLMIGWQYAF